MHSKQVFVYNCATSARKSAALTSFKRAIRGSKT
jgi:hypothetical protein